MKLIRAPPAADERLMDTSVGSETLRGSPPPSFRCRRKTSGMALVMVLMVIGVAFVLALAMLANASQQEQVVGNMARACQSEALAESGVRLGMYYLQNPLSAPKLNSMGYWPGAKGISLGGNLGALDVDVYNTDAAGVALAPFTYRVVANATASPSTSGVPHVTTAVVSVNTGTNNLAGRFTSNVTIKDGWKVTGNLEVAGNLKVNFGGSVNGTVWANNIQNSGYIQKSVLLGSGQKVWVPDAATVALFLPFPYNYTYNGVTYAATRLNLPGNTYSTGNNNTYGPTLLNPLGIYWSDMDVFVGNSITFNGLLILRNASLRFRGDNSSFNALPGWPALLVDGDMELEKRNWHITINGLVWTGGGLVALDTTTNKSSLTINGCWLCAGTQPITSTFDSDLSFTWDPKAVVGWFGTSDKPPSVKVISWQP